VAVGQLLPALEKWLYVLAGSAGETVFVRKPIYDALSMKPAASEATVIQLWNLEYRCMTFS